MHRVTSMNVIKMQLEKGAHAINYIIFANIKNKATIWFAPCFIQIEDYYEIIS